MWIILFFVVVACAYLVIQISKKYPEKFEINTSIENPDPKKNSQLGFNIMVGFVAFIAYFGVGMFINGQSSSKKSEPETASAQPAPEATPPQQTASDAHPDINEFRDRLNAALRENGTPELQVKAFKRHEVGGVHSATHDVSKGISIAAFLDDQDRVLNVFVSSGHSSHPAENMGRHLALIWSITRTLNPSGDAKQILGDVMQMEVEALDESDQSGDKATKSINRDGIDYEVMAAEGSSLLAIGKST